MCWLSGAGHGSVKTAVAQPRALEFISSEPTLEKSHAGTVVHL